MPRRDRTNRGGRALALGLGAALAAACGGGGGGDGDGGGPTPVPTATPTPVATATPSPAPTPGGAAARALILTTDFQSGSFAALPLDDPEAIATNLGSVHGDATGRSFGGDVFVVNRLGADSVQRLDGSDGFETLWQCSVGNGANPHDIVIVSEDKAYVTLYDDGDIAIVDPTTGADCAGFVRGRIDLSVFADDDGSAEPDRMALVGGRVYVSIQRLDRNDFFNPADFALLAVVDAASDTLVDVDPSTPETDGIRLSGLQPFAETKGLPVDGNGHLLVGQIGSFGAADGGIEIVDPATNEALGFLVTEQDLGGDVTDFVIVDGGRGYAVVADASFINSLVRFDPGTGAVQATLASGSAFLPDVEWDAERRRLLVASQDFAAPGVRIFDESDAEVTGAPIGTGLPPFNVILVE